jgi:hypothetical protein
MLQRKIHVDFGFHIIPRWRIEVKMDIVFGIGKIPLFKIIRSILDTVQNMLFPLCLSGEACGLVVQSAQLAVGVSAEGLDRFLGQKQGFVIQ